MLQHNTKRMGGSVLRLVMRLSRHPACGDSRQDVRTGLFHHAFVFIHALKKLDVTIWSSRGVATARRRPFERPGSNHQSR